MPAETKDCSKPVNNATPEKELFIYWAETYNSVYDAEIPCTSSYTHNVWITPERDINQECWAKKY